MTDPLISLSKRRQRLEMVRRALTEGPLGSVKEAAEAASTARCVFQPTYRSEISEELWGRLAHGAALTLKLNSSDLHRWLVKGDEAPAVEAVIRKLPGQVRCKRCERLLQADDPEWVAELGRCRPCRREERRAYENPQAPQYQRLLRKPCRVLQLRR